MNPLTQLLREIIQQHGPLRFSEFMQAALYHPEFGYYRRHRDPFGVRGDYYTAEQVQPVYGILLHRFAERVWKELGRPERFCVVELGAGRREMEPYFAAWDYWPVEFGDPLPQSFSGLVLANEFFDALPVEVVVWRSGQWRLKRVDWDGQRFCWVESDGVGADVECVLDELQLEPEEGQVVEVRPAIRWWVEEIARRLQRGCLLVVDYGYTREELRRFPEGTLVGYFRHMVIQDVLANPGEHDITAHVCFSHLERAAGSVGFERRRFCSLARFLIELGEEDRFASVLGVGDEDEQLKRRLQLKLLLFGLGEVFRVMELWKGSSE